MTAADDRFAEMKRIADGCSGMEFAPSQINSALRAAVSEVSRLRAQVAQLETKLSIERSTRSIAETNLSFAQNRRAEDRATITRVEALMEAQGPEGYVMNYALRGALKPRPSVPVSPQETPEPATTPEPHEHDWFAATTGPNQIVHLCRVGLCGERHHPWGRYGKECDGCGVLPGPPPAFPAVVSEQQEEEQR